MSGRAVLLNIRARMQYRADFLVGVVNGVIYQVTLLVFAGVLLGRFGGLAGWSVGGVLLIASIRMLGHAVYVVLFDNVMRTPRVIRDGTIDGYLVRPLPVLLQVLLSAFSINAVGDLVVAVGLFAAALDSIEVHWDLARAGYLIAGVVGAALVEGALQLVLASLSFFSLGSESFGIWLEETMASFGNYPMTIFPRAVEVGFTWVVPVAFLGYYPAAAILGRGAEVSFPLLIAVGTPMLGVVMLVCAILIWHQALKRHESING